MTPEKGVESFLVEPLRRGWLDAEAIEAAIEFATDFSPSSAFDRAQRWWQLRRQTGRQMDAICFGKGIRWLALLRRDGEVETFTATCRQLLLLTRLP